MDFLAAVVKKASGIHLGAYLDKHLFVPMGIKGAYWSKDPEGVARGAGELHIRAVDLALLGQLMLQQGRWKGKQLLPAELVQASVRASQSIRADYGYLWWLKGDFDRVLDEGVLEAWVRAGVPVAAAKKARALLGKRLPRKKFWKALETTLGKEDNAALEKALFGKMHAPSIKVVARGPVRAYAAQGWLGQHLVVVPAAKMVVVRMRSGDALDRGANLTKYCKSCCGSAYLDLVCK